MVNPWHILAVVFAAAIAFAGSVTYVMVLDAEGPNEVVTERARLENPDKSPRKDCNEIYGTAFRSDEERDWFNENCSTWAKSVSVIPNSGEEPRLERRQDARQEPSSPPPDGRDCNQVRGTTYRSNAERQWYLENCQGNRPNQQQQARQQEQQGQPQNQQQQGQPQDQQQATGDRTDCNQIRGTVYRSANERRWYVENCLGDEDDDDDDGRGPNQGQNANQGPAQQQQQQQQSQATGPDRTNCNQIRGTVYRSDSERAWFIANCLG